MDGQVGCIVEDTMLGQRFHLPDIVVIVVPMVSLDAAEAVEPIDA